MSQTRSSLLTIYPHITDRDRHLLRLLGEHQVLTTGQVHRLLFLARRTCQLRLAELRALGLIERFRFARAGGGSQPWHWTLDHAGQRFQAAAASLREPTLRASRERVARLSANPHLPHLVQANEFGVRLTAYARTHPEARLERWWSEGSTTKQYRTITADGHGLWSVDDRRVGYFLEVDTGTEPLHRVVAKLDRYARLSRRGGPRYPILFWLLNEEREDHLHWLLRGDDSDVPTATAIWAADPAEAVWLPADGDDRVRLVDLPSDDGRPVADNPNFVDGEFVA